MITTIEDEFIRNKIEDEVIWIATLNNGLIVYQDDNRPNYESAWLRLQKYCKENNLKITHIRCRFRSHWEHIPSNKDGYVFCKSALGDLSSGITIGYYNFGYLENGHFIFQKWRIPELLLDTTEERNLDDYQHLLI